MQILFKIKTIDSLTYASGKYVTKFTLDENNYCIPEICDVLGWFPTWYPNAGITYWSIIGLGDTTIGIKLENDIVIEHLKELIGLQSPLIIYYLFFYSKSALLPKECPAVDTNSTYNEIVNAWEWILDNWSDLPQALIQANNDKIELKYNLK